jgi:hypothetical protein
MRLIVILLAAGLAFKGASSLAERHYEPKTWIIVALVIGAVLAIVSQGLGTFSGTLTINVTAVQAQ